MLKAFTRSRQGRKKLRRIWGGACVHTVDGSRHKAWLLLNSSPKRGLPLQILYKSNRNKGTKKEKRKKEKQLV